MHKEKIILTGGAALVNITNSHWAKGLYVVTVKAGGKKIVKRIMR